MEEESVLNLIESLREEESCILVVEGQKDLVTLRKLGIEHTIEKIGGKRIFDDLSVFDGKNVIILTDFDKTGCKLLKRIRDELEVMGFNPNTYYWEKLKNLTRGEIRQIEELERFSE